MLGKDANFRQIGRQLIAVKDERAYNELKKEILFPEESDSILTFCYIDSEAGLTFDFLCPYNLKENKYYEIENKNFRQIFRKGFFDESEMEIVPYDLVKSNNLWDYIENVLLKNYEGDINLLKTRMVKDIDHLRENDYPDDILVILHKEGLNPEKLWVRLLKLDNGILSGKLQNEPVSDFGIHLNDTIKINFLKDDENILHAIYICK